MTTGLIRAGFWYLRHGETDWNALNLAQGNTEIPLNPRGLDQARAAAALLPGRGIAAIVSSPLSRARVTAEIAAAALGLPVAIDPDLHEVAFGARERQPIDSDWFRDWLAGRSTPEGAESFADLRLRAVARVNAALSRPPLVLIVAHGALFRALRAEMGLEPDVRLGNAAPVFCRPPDRGDAWGLEAVA